MVVLLFNFLTTKKITILRNIVIIRNIKKPLRSIGTVFVFFITLFITLFWLSELQLELQGLLLRHHLLSCRAPH
jgi:hypothetical protein